MDVIRKAEELGAVAHALHVEMRTLGQELRRGEAYGTSPLWALAACRVESVVPHLAQVVMWLDDLATEEVNR